MTRTLTWGLVLSLGMFLKLICSVKQDLDVDVKENVRPG